MTNISTTIDTLFAMWNEEDATHRAKRRKSWVSRRRMARTRSFWPIRASRQSTIRCQITCTCPGRSKLPSEANMFCARNR